MLPMPMEEMEHCIPMSRVTPRGNFHSILDAGEDDTGDDGYGMSCDVESDKIIVGASFSDTTDHEDIEETKG